MLNPWFVMLSWPIIIAILFRKQPMPVALCISFVGGYLLLPTRAVVDVPVLPPLDKTTIPAFSALIAVAITSRIRKQPWTVRKGWFPRHPVILLLLAVLIAGPFGTIVTNGDMLFFGPVVLPALRPYDAFAFVLSILTMLIPFVLARKVLSGPEGHSILLKTFIIAAAAYSFLALYEVRMSPQINVMVYGFFPHSFAQHIRAGGFRPLVFLDHGLSLGLFLALSTLSALGLFRIIKTQLRTRWILGAVWLFGVLFLSKNLGAFAITLLLSAVILVLRPRAQMMFACAIALAALSYPALRAGDQIPMQRIISFFETISEDRAKSFAFRVNNEEILLERARERPAFGWGGFNRNQVYNDRGVNISTTDGSWIILFGFGGWVRYIGQFGLLCVSIILLATRRREELDPVTVLLSLCLTANLIDLMPNATMTPLTWLMAGALAGRLEDRIPQGENAPVESHTPRQRRSNQPGYTRFPKGETPPAKTRGSSRSQRAQDAIIRR